MNLNKCKSVIVIVALSISLFSIFQVIFICIINTIINRYFNESEYLNNVENNTPLILWFSAAFITLITEIIVMIGVNNVFKITDIRNEVNQMINEANCTSKDSESMIKNQIQAFTNRNRDIEAFINIQTGMSVGERIIAALHLLQQNNINSNWRYFKTIRDNLEQEVSNMGSLSERELNSNLRLKILLDLLSSPDKSFDSVEPYPPPQSSDTPPPAS